MSSIWRKRVPSSRNSDTSNNHPISANRTNPAPSEPIAGGTDLVISAIEPTLSALKELSSLAKKIPYISPAASLILQALKMWDEVKQCKGEWKLVMEKLVKVGSVIVNVGNMCQNHGLKLEELPSDLLAIFESFQRCLFLLLDMSWSNPNQATCMGLRPR
ncbi:hypothetical protein BGW80DRAFT_429393 [Lactifluus volemus]|nr:hypothetical protein BGW80DRAFT_429393 [Lactifluus volemus]